MAQHALSTLDTLSFVGLERTHLRSAVYRRVFGDQSGPVRIGRYSILERVGAGARGVVFKAFDNQLDRLVALKVLSARTEDRAELIREAKALARLSHPNVLSVYEVGETEGGQVFLATEYVKGWTLRGWFDEEHRSQDAIVDAMRQVALGVQAAHDEGLVHRDLKPANILVGEDGRVRVADFGLARFDPAALQPSADVPRDGVATTTAGTPGYMAPELFEGKPASAASDQYALAVTLHELLHGETPASTAGLRGPSGAALRRGLDPDPASRFESVKAFADALVVPPKRRRRVALLAAAGLVAAGATASALLLLPAGTTTAPNNDIALLEAEAALPEDPAAALEALRGADDLEDPRLLPLAEEALALGPADAAFALPENATNAHVYGSLLVFLRSDGTIAARRLSVDDPLELDPKAIGIRDTQEHDMYVLGWRGPILDIGFDHRATLNEIDAWAARTLDASDHDVSISGDGSRVARLDRLTQTLTVVETRTGDTVWTHGAEGSHLNSVQLDAHGRRVAWTNNDGTTWIHDLGADASYELPVQASMVLFEPDENHVLVEGRYSGLHRVRLSDDLVVRLIPQDESFGAVQLSPDHAWVAAAGYDDTVYLTRPRDAVVRELEGSSFAFSPDSRRIATVHGNHIRVHDLEGGQVRTLSVPARIRDMDFGPDGSIWSVGADDVVRRHTLSDPIILPGHGASALVDLSMSRDGQTLASLGEDFTIRIWDVETQSGRILTDIDFQPLSVALDEAGNRVAVPKIQDRTRFFDLGTGELLGDAPHASDPPVLGPNGAIVGAGNDGVWSNLGGETTMLGTEKCSSFTANDELIAAICGEDVRRLHVWKDGKPSATPLQIKDDIRGALHVWPDADHLLVLGSYGTPDVFSIEDRISLADLPLRWNVEDYLPRSASSENHDLVIGTRQGVFSAWPGSTTIFEIDATGAMPGITPLAVSGDGKRVAFAAGRRRIVIHDRPLSNAHHDLAAVLEAHTPVEGQL